MARTFRTPGAASKSITNSLNSIVNHFLDDFFDEVAEAGEKLAAEIREATFALKTPEIEDMFKHVYSEPHPVIDEQLDWLKRYEASFGGEN